MGKEDFYKTYPLVFPDGEPECGFCCGSGWDQLLDSLFFVINKELAQIPKDKLKFRVSQIKEKFGTLRIYVENSPTDYINEVIVQAESMSSHICEICGEYGQVRDSAHWIKVRCDDCEEKHFANRHPKQ